LTVAPNESSGVTDVTSERIALSEKSKRVRNADPFNRKSYTLLLHSALDIGNLQGARRLIQFSSYFHLLAFELLGFFLVINLVGSAVGLQDVLVARLYDRTCKGFRFLRLPGS
jgi:hypothetical protein